MTPRRVPGTLVVALLLGTAIALPAAAGTPPPPPGTPISPPPTGDVLPAPPPTAPPPTEPVPGLPAPTTPPPTTATALEPTAPASDPAPSRPRPPAPAPAPPEATPPEPVPPAPTPLAPATPGPDVTATRPATFARDRLVAVGTEVGGLAALDVLPVADDGPAPASVPDVTGRTAPTQRRLGSPSSEEEVAAPAPATTRTGADRSPFRRDVLPLLLLGGAVCMAYVACLQVAERRRQRRAARR